MMTDTTTLRTVAAAANAHNWDANALLVAATLMAENWMTMKNGYLNCKPCWRWRQ